MNSSQPQSAGIIGAETFGQGRGLQAPPRDSGVLLTELQLQALAKMRDTGMLLLQDLEEQSDLPLEKRPSIAQRANAFEKISKSVRQTIALEQETFGLREKRVNKVQTEWANTRRTAVRRSVEKSLTVGKPNLDRVAKERLLGDLFSDYKNFTTGNIPDLIADICKTLGIAPDLSLWETPSLEDIALPAGYDWVVPANGDKPYTVRTSPSGIRVRAAFDSYSIKHANDPPPDG